MTDNLTYECLSQELWIVFNRIRTDFRADPSNNGWVTEWLYELNPRIRASYDNGDIDKIQYRRIKARWYYARKALEKECLKINVSLA